MFNVYIFCSLHTWRTERSFTKERRDKHSCLRLEREVSWGRLRSTSTTTGHLRRSVETSLRSPQRGRQTVWSNLMTRPSAWAGQRQHETGREKRVCVPSIDNSRSKVHEELKAIPLIKRRRMGYRLTKTDLGCLFQRTEEELSAPSSVVDGMDA